MELAGAASHSPLLAAVAAADGDSDACAPSETRVGGIDLAGDAGTWDSTLASAETHWDSTYAYGELAADRQEVTNLRLPGQYDERLLGSLGLQGPYYNWNRWYLPALGRYMELDPIALAGGFNGLYGPDWYNYANGNPLNYIDPTGWEPKGIECNQTDSTVTCCLKQHPGDWMRCNGTEGPPKQPPTTCTVQQQPPPPDAVPNVPPEAGPAFWAGLCAGRCGKYPPVIRQGCWVVCMAAAAAGGGL